MDINGDYDSSFSAWLQQVSWIYSACSVKYCADIQFIYFTLVCLLLDVNYERLYSHRNMGGLDQSDALISDYAVLWKTRKLYSSLFLHFVDIGVVNAFILPQPLAGSQNKRAKTQRGFGEVLVLELVDWMLLLLQFPKACFQEDTTGQGTQMKPEEDAEHAIRKLLYNATTMIFSCVSRPSRDCFNNFLDANSF